MVFAERSQHVRKQRAGRGTVEADSQASAPRRLDGLDDALCLVEQSTALCQKGLTCRCELYLPTRSLEQSHAELLLELTDLLAERRLRDVQSCCGAAEVKLLRDGHEVLHKAKVDSFDRRNLPTDRQPVLDVRSLSPRR